MLEQKHHRKRHPALVALAENKEHHLQCARAHIELEKEMQYLRLLRSANHIARQNPAFSVVQDIAIARTVFNIRCHRFTIEQLEGRPSCFGCAKVNVPLYRYVLGLAAAPEMTTTTPVDVCIECAVALKASREFNLYESDPRD